MLPAETLLQGLVHVERRGRWRWTASRSRCRSTPSTRSSAVPSRCKRPCSAGRGRHERPAAAIQRALGDGPAGAAARHRQRAEDRRRARSADPGRRVLHVLGAQDPRLDARARRAEPRRLERRAATVRRRHQDAPQRDRGAVEGQPILVPDGARAVARAGVRGVGRRAASATRSSSPTSTPDSFMYWR